MLNSKKSWVILVVSALLVAGGYSYYNSAQAQEQETGEEPLKTTRDRKSVV